MKYVRNSLLIILLTVGIAACGGNGPTKLDVAEGIAVFNQAGDLLAASTLKAGEQGFIGWREACKIEQYSQLAKRLSDEALIALVRDDIETAQGKYEAARDAINGIGEEAQRLVNDNCSGN